MRFWDSSAVIPLVVRQGGSAEAERAAISAEAISRDVLRRTHVVTDVERVKASAHRLLRVHPLRAADALQLAAALAWAEGAPAGLVLHTFDRRLALAAEREGFRVIPALGDVG